MSHKRISSKQSLLGTECCTNHALLIFHLPANHILLNIPMSSYLDCCSSGWSWFTLIQENVMRPLSNLPPFDFSRNQTKVKSVFPQPGVVLYNRLTKELPVCQTVFRIGNWGPRSTKSIHNWMVFPQVYQVLALQMWNHARAVCLCEE